MFKNNLSLATLIITSVFVTSIIIACSHTDSYALKSLYIDKNLTKENTLTEEWLSNTDNPKQLKDECDEEKLAKSCLHYAMYIDFKSDANTLAYNYYKKSFDLGAKISGYYVGGYQLNHPEWFNEDERLTMDEIVYYLEQSLEAGNIDATRILAMAYRNQKYDYIDYKKSEYYTKLLIKQNKVRGSRFLLASLYAYEMEDKSKIDTTIQLYHEDLVLERNLLSAYTLMAIYRNPTDFGVEVVDGARVLAYAYITRDLRKEEPNNVVSNDENSVIVEMEKILSTKQLQRAKKLYQEIKAEMDAHANNKSEELVSP